MKKQTKKIPRLLSLVLALVMIAGMLPTAALAADTAENSTQSVTIWFSVVDSSQMGFPIMRRQLTVPAGTGAGYGWLNAEPGHTVGGQDHGVKPGEVTVMDALLYAHQSVYGDKFNKSTMKDYISGSSSYVTKIFQRDASKGIGFAVNDQLPVGTMSDGYAANECVLKNGDEVTWFLLSGDYYNDYYSYFDKKSVEIEAGSPLSLTLRAFYSMETLSGTPGKPTKELTTLGPVAGADLLLVNAEGTAADVLGGTAAVKTDEKGQFTYSFEKPGTYYLSAAGKVAGMGLENPIVLPWCEVTVTQSNPQGPQPAEVDAYWPNFRGNNSNMAVVDVKTPIDPAKTKTKWALKGGSSWADTPSLPILADGSVVAMINNRLVKIDPQTGKITAEGKMVKSPGFSVVSPTCGGGMIFCQLGGGTVQAFNAKTLESLWVYTDPKGGQSNSPVLYSDGFVYTGFWNGETKEADFVCLSAFDEDTTQTNEAKQAKWIYAGAGGFYWAGAAAVGSDFVVVGTDDGTGSNDGPAKLLSFHKTTGAIADTLAITGDQRSSLAYSGGSLYFTTKNGSIHKTDIDAVTGKFSNHLSYNNEGFQCTCTPVVYGGRVYYAIGGGPGAPGSLVVADATTLQTIKDGDQKFEFPLKGYPQGSVLLSTGYEKESGYLYLYSTYNKTPGGLSMLKIKAGATSYGEASVIEIYDAKDYPQYCIASPICDAQGVIYYKNDSGNILAVEQEKDVTAPSLSEVSAARTDAASGSVTFTSGEAGRYEIRVLEKGAAAPTAFSGEGTVCGTQKITAKITLTAAAADVYVLVKDEAGNLTVSQKLEIAQAEPVVPPVVTDTLETTLKNGFTQRGSRMTFDVFAKDKNGAKLPAKDVTVTLNGKAVSVNWDDSEKTSYTLKFTTGDAGVCTVALSTKGGAKQTYTFTYTPAQAGEVIGRCVFSMDAFTVGGGYLISPRAVDIREGETGAQLLVRVLKENGFGYSNTGSVTSGFYLEYIKGDKVKALPVTPSVPAVLKAHLKTIENRSDASCLGEFDYTSGSGWMYCVNNVFPNVGFADYYPCPGDVVRAQFTLALGSDIGGGMPGSGGYYAVGNKDAITEYIAEKGIENVSEEVLAAVQKLDASPAELAKAVENDQKEKPSVTPPAVTPGVEMKPQVTVSENTATAQVSQSSVAAAVNAAKQKGVAAVSVTVEPQKSVNAAKVTVPDLAAVAQAKLALELNTSVGSLSVAPAVLEAMVKQAGGAQVTFTVTVKNPAEIKLSGCDLTNAAAAEVKISAGGKNLTGFDGKVMEVLIPVGRAFAEGTSYQVIVISDDGTKEITSGKCLMRSGRRYVKTDTTHLSTFVVTTKKSMSFADVKADAWYHGAVEYAYDNGLFSGVSETAFAPDAAMSRGMLVTVLYRLAGQPAPTGKNTFSDVQDGRYYQKAVVWAAENQIVSGYGEGRFGPDDAVTRQQMAAILYRFAKYQKRDLSKTAQLKEYADAAAVSGYAAEAMKWAVAEKLIVGDEGRLMPFGGATRAQVATVLMRYGQSVSK